MAGPRGTRARRRSQPWEEGWGHGEGVAWSPEDSLTLSKLQSANEKRGAFWVISLSEETPICVLSLGEAGIKIDGAPPVCQRPRAGTAISVITSELHHSPEKWVFFVLFHRQEK